MINFEKRITKIISYENKCFEDLKNFVVPYNDKLADYNCEIYLSRYYGRYNEDEIYKERIILGQCSYCCFSAQFQVKGADPDDNSGLGFQIVYNIWQRVWYGLGEHFSKGKLKQMFSDIIKDYNEIIKNGFEKTVLNYQELDRNKY